MCATSTEKRGRDRLSDPTLNKGAAFSEAERREYGLLGLVSPHVEKLDEQVERAYEGFLSKTTPLEQHIYLRRMQDTNETAFYRLLTEHLADMLPVIYTPTVGLACEQFSEITRVPRGLFISYPDRHLIDEMLANAPFQNVKVIVVTDGERILGLGDQGIGGMGISIGKLSLYSAAGGIHPANTLPIVLDCGTNNEERLKDPLYIGWRNHRVSGDEYYDFVDTFVQAVKARWPDVLLQFEDFAIQHAQPLLAKYRDQLCMFNDDVQGTASVAVGTLLAASKVVDVPVRDHRVVFLGAGSAGAGIAEQVIGAMVRDGLDEATARSRIFMVDRYGLIHDQMADLAPFQARLAQPKDSVADWAGDNGQIDLLRTVAHAKPTVLVGVCGQPGLFTEEVVKTMAASCAQPIVFPMSNPTSRAEGKPEDILHWTEGKALVATGSPFDPVNYGGVVHEIAQSNNSYIFPGIGLGVIACKAKRVTNQMFMAASEALAAQSPAMSKTGASLLPAIEDIREVSKLVAFAVGQQAVKDGVADAISDDNLRASIDTTQWQPRYE